MIKTLFLIAILGLSDVSQEAQKWNGKFFKRGQSARCADFVGEVVRRAGGTPPVGYQKCTSWLGWGKKVSLSNIQKGDIINIEKSLSYGSKISGHYVQGHVDTTAKISKIVIKDKTWIVTFKVNKNFSKYLIEKG